MALTEGQKSEIRRHLGYPEPATALNFPGGPPYAPTFGQAGAHIGDRYTPAFYDLEYRLLDIPQTGEVEVLGANSPFFQLYTASASALIKITTAQAAATIATILPLQIGTEAATVSIAIGDVAQTIAGKVAASVNAFTIAPTVLVAVVGIGTVLLQARTAGDAFNSFPVMAWGNGDVNFAITDTTSSPQPATTLTNGVSPPGPMFMNPDSTPPLPIYGHLPIIRYWEAQIPNAADGMDTIQAGKFTQQPHEYAKRRAAYISACRDMAQTLAVVYYGTNNYRGGAQLRRVY